MQLRPYQQEALNAIYSYFERANGHPVISLGTGLGKSLVCAEFCRWALSHDEDVRIFVVVPTKELCKQNYDEIINLWPDAPVGVYCAGLGRKDASQILFGTIQSLYKAQDKLVSPDLILCDEAHYMKASDEGMWRGLITWAEKYKPDLRVVGLTATPWRMKEGRLDENGLFDEIVYEYGLKEGIRDGWLAPLITKNTIGFLNTEGVGTRGGEFIESELQNAVDTDKLNREVSAEIIARSEGRKKWLVFCTGIDHSNHIAEILRELGVNAEAVTSEDDAVAREQKIESFRNGNTQALCSANILTTGFNVPSVDLIAFLRPTKSSGLLLQMAGRGSRKAEGKENCLILDFSRNLFRMGPLDLLDGRVKLKGKGGGDAPIRVCDECETINHAAAKKCVECGKEFPQKQKIFRELLNAPVLSGESKDTGPQELTVTGIKYAVHQKDGRPDSLRVTYQCGFMDISEWKHFELPGDIRASTERWWRARCGVSCPKNAKQAIVLKDRLAVPQKIVVRKNGKYFNVISYKWQQPEVNLSYA